MNENYIKEFLLNDLGITKNQIDGLSKPQLIDLTSYILDEKGIGATFHPVPYPTQQQMSFKIKGIGGKIVVFDRTNISQAYKQITHYLNLLHEQQFKMQGC